MTDRVSLSRAFGLGLLIMVTGAALSLAAIASGAAATKDTVIIVKARFGDHPEFSRVVFDWETPVEYSIAEAQGEVRISFAALAKIDKSLLRRVGSRLITDLTTVIEKGTTEVRLKTLPNTRIGHFRVGTKVVVDVFEPSAAAEKPDAKKDGDVDTGPPASTTVVTGKPASEAPTSEPAVVPSAMAEAIAPVADIDRSATAGSTQTPESQSETPPLEPVATESETASTPDADVGENKQTAAVSDLQTTQSAVNRKTETEAKVASSAREDEAPRAVATEVVPSAPSRASVADRAASASGVSTPASEEAEPKVPALPFAQVTAIPAPSPATRTVATGSDRDLKIRLSEDDKELALEFSWPAPVPAAVFERSGFVWVVFGRHVVADLLGLNGGDSALASIEQFEHAQATVLRLRLRAGLFISMTRERAVWRLKASPIDGGPSSEIAIVNQPNSADGARVFLPVIDTGERVVVDDPEVGDEIIVVPVLPAGFGIRATRNFAQFRVLASPQGVAVMARLEGLEVTPLRNGVAISAEGGIALSSQESIRRARKRRKISEPLRAPLLAIADWRGADVGEFYPQRRALQRAVVEAPDAGRNVARWELAKFNFSRNFMADARAVLELMLAQDAAATSDPALRAMRGLLSVLAHRNDEAAADLLHVALDGRPDTQLWRGLLLKSEGNLVAANQAFASAAAALTLLPEDWRRRLLFEWAEAAVAAEDESSFKMVEELLSELEIPVARRGQLEFLKGRAAEIRQEPDVALEHYEAVIAGGSRRARIRAAVARVNLMLESGTTTRDQAVAALEELTHAWRGDTHEIALLNRQLCFDVQRQVVVGVDRECSIGVGFCAVPIALEEVAQGQSGPGFGEFRLVRLFDFELFHVAHPFVRDEE